MREIKFRAWDEKKKRMILPSGAFGNQQYWSIESGNTQHWGIFQVGKKHGRICGSADNSGILMQYTGLKDKNGVEIYEGDVVKFFPIYDGSFNIYEVSMEYYAWCFLAKTKEYKTFEECCGLDRNIDCEVIGNIYENPELFT